MGLELSPEQMTAIAAKRRERWMGILRSHLLTAQDGGRLSTFDLTSFDGVTVWVRTKTKHFASRRFHLGDEKRLILAGRDGTKFTPQWEKITRIDFCYTNPPDEDLHELLRKTRRQ
jgi:hypothetical protein